MIKNPITRKYLTRSQTFLWHIKCKDAAASGGFYGDAINYHQHILNDMMILEYAAMPHIEIDNMRLFKNVRMWLYMDRKTQKIILDHTIEDLIDAIGLLESIKLALFNEDMKKNGKIK